MIRRPAIVSVDRLLPAAVLDFFAIPRFFAIPVLAVSVNLNRVGRGCKWDQDWPVLGWNLWPAEVLFGRLGVSDLGSFGFLTAHLPLVSRTVVSNCGISLSVLSRSSFVLNARERSTLIDLRKLDR